VSRLFAPALLSAAALSGCASDLSGEWVGSCDFQDARYGYSSAITVNVADGEGATLEGELTVDMYDGSAFVGEMDGDRADSSVELRAPLRVAESAATDATVAFDLTLTGRLEGEDTVLVGDCTFAYPEQAGGLRGELRLER
jgi:hypothetical protein